MHNDTAHMELAAMRNQPDPGDDLNADPVTARQMRYLADRITDMEAQLGAGEQRMAAIERDLRENTETTKEVRDILGAAKGAFKFFNVLGLVLKWLGGLAGAGVALYTVWHMATHGGKPPGST